MITIETILTVQEWSEILENPSITKQIDLDIIQAIYSFENHQASAGQIGKMLGMQGKNLSSPINSEIGRYAKRIAKFYDIDYDARQSLRFKYYDIFFDGWDEKDMFIWRLKENLILALEKTNLINNVTFAEEIPTSHNEVLTEGIKKTILVNSYERNPKAREICIRHWGSVCSVCNFNFEKTYGNLGKGFIHVHHLKQLSEIGQQYQVNPIEDLRPVCPNCHSMIHKNNPPLTIEELKEIIANYQKK